MEDGSCKKCNINARFDGKKCVCLSNYQGDGFNCYSRVPNANVRVSGGSVNVGGNIFSFPSGAIRINRR